MSRTHAEQTIEEFYHQVNRYFAYWDKIPYVRGEVWATLKIILDILSLVFDLGYTLGEFQHRYLHQFVNTSWAALRNVYIKRHYFRRL